MLATSCGNAATRASSEVVGGSSGNTISVALLPPLCVTSRPASAATAAYASPVPAAPASGSQRHSLGDGVARGASVSAPIATWARSCRRGGCTCRRSHPRPRYRFGAPTPGDGLRRRRRFAATLRVRHFEVDITTGAEPLPEDLADMPPAPSTRPCIDVAVSGHDLDTPAGQPRRLVSAAVTSSIDFCWPCAPRRCAAAPSSAVFWPPCDRRPFGRRARRGRAIPTRRPRAERRRRAVASAPVCRPSRVRGAR
jgi:hypothetical protein